MEYIKWNIYENSPLEALQYEHFNGFQKCDCELQRQTE